MYLPTLLSALAFATIGLTQSSMSMSMSSEMPTATGTASASSASTAVYVVKVSNKNGDLTFEPDSMTAPVGSMVQFHFYPKNHSVVQAAFSNPCEPINKVMSEVTGFKSGFMPTKKDDKMMPGFTIPIMDDKPIWYYCSQKMPVNHCMKGMVGVINPPAESTGKTIDAFKAKAAQAPMMMMGGASNSTSSSGSAYGSGSGSSGSSSGSPGSGSGSGSGSASGTGISGVAGSTGLAAPGPGSSAFPGAASSLSVVGWSAFAGLGLALLM